MKIRGNYLNIHWPLKSMGLMTGLLGCKNPHERKLKQLKFLNQNLKICVTKYYGSWVPQEHPSYTWCLEVHSLPSSQHLPCASWRGCSPGNCRAVLGQASLTDVFFSCLFFYFRSIISNFLASHIWSFRPLPSGFNVHFFCVAITIPWPYLMKYLKSQLLCIKIIFL